MKIEKVTRRAQEQFQMVLEEQSRSLHFSNIISQVLALALGIFILLLPYDFSLKAWHKLN